MTPQRSKGSFIEMNICGKNVKKFRKEKNLDQVELSAALSVDHDISLDQSDISEIERGVRGVRDYEVKALAEIFGVSVDELLRE